MSKITIKKKTENFTILDNTLFKDENLSWKSKGLLAYLLHLPDDWQIYLEDLKNRSTDGIDSTRSAMNELIEKGYIEREEVREQGKFKGYEYTVLEKPISVKPKTEKPISDNPTLLSTESNKLLNIKNTNKSHIKDTSIRDTSIIDNKPIKKETTFDIMIKEFTENEELKTTIYDFIKMRKTIKKPMTDRALKTILNKLNKFTMNEEKQILILEQSILSSWSDIYELKTETFKQKTFEVKPQNKIATLEDMKGW